MTEPHEYTLKEVQAFCDRVSGRLRIGLSDPADAGRSYLTRGSRPRRAYVVSVHCSEGGWALAQGDSFDEAFGKVVAMIDAERSGG